MTLVVQEVHSIEHTVPYVKGKTRKKGLFWKDGHITCLRAYGVKSEKGGVFNSCGVFKRISVH